MTTTWFLSREPLAKQSIADMVREGVWVMG